MKKAIVTLSLVFKEHKMDILACCCGHHRYPPSIVYHLPKPVDINFELFSAKVIDRKSRFYKKDKQGYYYIPETVIR